MRKLVLFITGSLTALLTLIVLVPSEARNRPTVGPSDETAAYDLCLVNGGDTNAGTGANGTCAGAICYCCYDDGCFICNNVGGDCKWDGKARARTVKQRLKAPLGSRDASKPTTAPSPSTSRPQPPRGTLKEPGLLEGGGGSSSTLGPASTGRPMAPPPPPAGQLR